VDMCFKSCGMLVRIFIGLYEPIIIYLMVCMLLLYVILWWLSLISYHVSYHFDHTCVDTPQFLQVYMVKLSKFLLSVILFYVISYALI
jgi:hypothetical protein